MLTLTLTRPRKLNAVSVPMWHGIADLLTRMHEHFPDAKGLILKGAGGAFSSGADLSDLAAAAGDPAAAARFCDAIVSALYAIAAVPLPTLAAVDGIAHGGGLELAVAADCRLATRASTFRLPFARLGVVPDRLTLGRLLALIGPSSLQRLLISGEAISAAEAYRIGLVDEVVNDAEELEATLATYRARLDADPSAAISGAKQVIRRLLPLPTRDGLADEMIRSIALMTP